MENQFSFDLAEMDDNPFSRTVDASCPYLSSSFREALAALYYGLEYGSRILILTADHGLGKTTLLRHFERRIHDRSRTFLLSPRSESGREVLCKLLAEIGGAAPSDDLHTMRVQIDRILSGVAEAETPFILFLDYDQNSEQFALDTLRYLAILESYKKRALRVVIASSSGVADELQGSEFAAEIRRVPLAPLSAAEVEAYVDHRLRLVGWRGSRLFTAKAFALIVEKSSGNPSAINEICFNILQNPEESESGRSDNPPQNEDFVVDENYVDDSVLPDPQPVLTPAHSRRRRMAALTCIVLMLVLAIAGLWYRNAIKTRTARHVIAHVTNAGTAGNGISNTALEPASESARNRETAGLSHVATSAVSAVSSPTPTKAASTIAVRLTNAVPPILLSSPAATAPNKYGDQSAQAIAKDYKVITAPLSPIVVPRQTSPSSPVQQQTTAPHTAIVRSVAATAEGDDAMRTANEMAAYEIRLGDAYMNLGDYDKALGSFSRAIAFAPDNKEAEEKIKRARRAKAAEEDILQ
ncbi:MAG: tetratricopeptide repeat protein [Deltaproteobacteria bacterium]|nr:tetratricopeptide repeat protein [Deltaproteobacteria bacterium]